MLKKYNRGIAFSFICLCGLAFYRIEMPASLEVTQVLSESFKTFPSQIGDWVGHDSPVDERTFEILETRNVLSRSYKNTQGESVHLLIVGSLKDRRVAHPPEVCYYGSDYQVLNGRDRNILLSDRELRVREFFAQSEKNRSDQQNVLYFYKIGEKFTTNYYTQQLQFALDSLSKKSTQVLLIRIASKQQQSQENFLKDLFPLVTKLNLS